MSKANRDAVITHDDLITFARECRRARDIPPEQQNALRNRWECKFKHAIDQARLMGVLAVDILTDLQNLVDPNSGESICPYSLQRHLANTIAHLSAVAAKKERSLFRQQLIGASS